MVRTAAAVALIRVDPPGSEAVAVLVEAMVSRESDGTAYLTACAAAGELSPAAVPALLEFLKGAPAPASPQRDLQKGFRAREAAIELLGRMGVNAQSAVPALVEILNNQRMPHRREAAEALGLIGPAALAAVPSLKAALADEEVWLRLNAAVALARIEAQDESHIRGLTRFLEDRDASLRAAAASSLGELGAGARSAIPDLRRLAGDDDDESVLSEVTRAVEAIEADAAK
jgi:HEAT repeat protein